MDLGNIQKYFTDTYQMKEWNSNSPREGGAEVGARKRKGNGCLEQQEHGRTWKSRRLMVEVSTTSGTTNSRTQSPLFMGAKSGIWREPTD